MPVTSSPDNQSVDYRYFVCDLMSNELLVEIPFKNVSYSRSIVEAGTFTGDIAVIEDTYNLSLYENTLPGKTALFIVRNNVCVWGGIIWGRTYSLIDKILSVSAAEFTSYFNHRVLWKTWSSSYEAQVVVSSGVATITLSYGQYDFEVGELVWLDWGTDLAKYSGYFAVDTVDTTDDDRSVITVEARYVDKTKQEKDIPDMGSGDPIVITVETRQDTYEFVKDLLTELNTDLFDFDFANDTIEPGIELFNEVSSVSRSNNLATVVTSKKQELVAGQRVKVSDISVAGFDDTEATVSEVLTDYSFTYENTGDSVSTTTIQKNTTNVVSYSISKYVATITTDEEHGLSPENIIFIDNVSDVFDGFTTVYAVPSTTTFQIYAASADVKLSYTDRTVLTTLPTVAVVGSVRYTTFGEYTTTGDIGIDLSQAVNKSQNLQSNPTIRGFELKTVAEILEDYSTKVNGFEYRIDCTYDTDSNSFKKYLKLLPLTPATLLEYVQDNPAAEYIPPSAFGADRFIFEYPGNVLEAQFEENAEEAATRFFVQGRDEALPSDVSQPYSAATNYKLLREGWPLLDETETLDSNEETTLWQHAGRLLEESIPPISTFSIAVNGSANPQLGTYNPGDWCTVVLNDPFVSLRSSSYLEQAYGDDGILVRKISAFSVTVPDSPSFPEQVSLELVVEPSASLSGIEILNGKAFSGD